MTLETIGTFLGGLGALIAGIAQLITALGNKKTQEEEDTCSGADAPPRMIYAWASV